MTDYQFPNISFNSKIIGPASASPPWRDGYAIIGDFNRGPITPTRSNQLSVLTALYGEDKSSGSIALQQAMMNGASNATVVRVVPGSEYATMSFELASDNLNLVPNTGYESLVANSQILDSYNRTTGFTLNLDYIGSADYNTTFYGRITTEAGLINHPTYEGRGQVAFNLISSKPGLPAEPVIYEDVEATLDVSFSNAAPGEYQVVTYLEGDSEYVEGYLEPGYTLQANDVAQVGGLAIASAPFMIDRTTGKKGVLVKGYYSPTTTYTGEVASIPSAKQLLVDTLRHNISEFTPTEDQVDVMVDCTVLINETPFVLSALTAGVDNHVLTLSTVKSVTGTALEDSTVAFVPTVTAVAYTPAVDATPAFTTVTLKGVLGAPLASQKVAFSNALTSNNTIASIATAFDAVAGTVTLQFDGDIRSDVKVNDYALIVSAATTPVSAPTTVNYSSKGLLVVSYTFVPLDETATLNAYTQGKSYFRLPASSGATYDATFVITEGQGDQFIEFNYLVGPEVITQATVLGTETFGLKQKFGFEGDTRTFLNSAASWAVPFAKASITVGGKPGTAGAYPTKTPAANILKDLEYAIYNDIFFSSMVGNVETAISTTPYKFSISPSFSGVEGNRCHWSLERHIDGPTALYESNDSGVITVTSIPNILQANFEDYSLLVNDVLYPVTATGVNTITVDVGEDTNAAFLDTFFLEDELTFVSQAQTRDLLIRLNDTDVFSADYYGATNYYSFLDGRDSATFSYRDFYSLDGKAVLRVRSLSPGAYGNNLRVTLLPDEVTTDSAKYYLTVEDMDTNVITGPSKKETYLLDNTQVDNTSGLYLSTLNSNLIRAYFIPAVQAAGSLGLKTVAAADYQLLPLRVAPALEIQNAVYANGPTRVNAQGANSVKNVPLVNGVDFKDNDPPTAVKARIAGYLNALDQVQSLNLTWIGVVGIYEGDRQYKAVFDRLHQIVEESTPATGGFRRAVTQLVPNASPRQAEISAGQHNSPNGRYVIITGLANGRTSSNLAYQNAAVVGAYIGLGASRPPHISNASTYGDRTPLGLNFSTASSNPSLLDAYTRAGVEVFFKDDGLGAYKFLNGLSTSSTAAGRYVSVSHVWDQVRDEVYKALLPYKSQPATPQLWSRIATACDAVMSKFLRDEWLMRFTPTVCDERNNSEADLLKATINVSIQGTPSFPADFFKVLDTLDLRVNFALGVQPGQSISDF